METPVSNKSLALAYSAFFNADSKIHKSAIIYDGATFRQNMTLIMDEDTFIGTYAIILVPKLVMEKGSQINAGAILTGKQPIYLGRNVVVGYGAVLITASDTSAGKYMNEASSPEDERKIIQGPIHIHDNSFIGANATIMPSVIIGPNSVIGAGCYVNKSVAPNRKLIPISGLYVELPRFKDGKV
jgi:acetyltransferase-like isoleucine patch superfamily enzyme